MAIDETQKVPTIMYEVQLMREERPRRVVGRPNCVVLTASFREHGMALFPLFLPLGGERGRVIE